MFENPTPQRRVRRAFLGLMSTVILLGVPVAAGAVAASPAGAATITPSVSLAFSGAEPVTCLQGYAEMGFHTCEFNQPLVNGVRPLDQSQVWYEMHAYIYYNGPNAAPTEIDLGPKRDGDPSDGQWAYSYCDVASRAQMPGNYSFTDACGYGIWTAWPSNDSHYSWDNRSFDITNGVWAGTTVTMYWHGGGVMNHQTFATVIRPDGSFCDGTTKRCGTCTVTNYCSYSPMP
jgi:hypothetical protein